MKRAYFMLQPEQIDDGTDWSRYDLIVCNPDMPAEKVSRLNDKTRALLLAYDNCMDMPSAQWSSPYWKRKREILEPFVLRDHGVDLDLYRLTQLAALRLAEFHVGHLGQREFNGMYLDRMPRLWPKQQERLDLSWEYHRQFYTAVLRNQCGARLIANCTGGALIDPMLDGIAMEYIGSGVDLVEALGAFAQQAEVAWTKGPIFIAWCRTDEEREAAEQLRLLPGFHLGDVKPIRELRAALEE